MADPDPVVGEVIASYSRTQAINDGELIDVTSTAREAGLRCPVALTRAAWAQYVAVPPGVRGQDERGRLWDTLWMLRMAITLAAATAGPTMLYTLYVRNDNRRPKRVQLKSVCGPGDDPAPVITIMLPEED